MVKVVVTGGAGFIGSHLTDALLTSGADVSVIDNFSTGTRNNLDHLSGAVEILDGSILDPELLKRAFSGADVVYHEAAVPSVPRSIRDPLTSHDANATGTLQVLLAARDANVRRVVYASSSSYYGDTPTLPKREDMPPNPLSPYALQKFVGEKYTQMFYTLYGLETVGLRYFNVFGPRQDPSSEYSAVIPKFIDTIKKGNSPVIYGDGSTSRDFTFIADVVRANMHAATVPEAAGEVFNIAGGKETTLLELLKIIQDIQGSNINPIHEAVRPGDIAHSLADISKAKKILKWSPEVTLPDGLRITVPAV